MGLEVGGGICPCNISRRAAVFVPAGTNSTNCRRGGRCLCGFCLSQSCFFFHGGVWSNQNSGSTEKGEDKSTQGNVRHNRMCLLDGS